MRFGLWISVSALSVLFLSCGSPKNLESHPQKLIGGDKVGLDIYPASVSIWTESGNTRQLCTATFVSDNTLITAAHCMYRINSTTGEVGGAVKLRELKETKAIRAFANPRAGGVSAYDVAIAIFPDDTADAWMPVSTKIPQIGSVVDMVGYGSRKMWNGSDHERSKGSNMIDGDWNGMILTRRAASSPMDVAASPGDSGGPMIHNDHVIGVSSGGSGGRESYHAAIGNPENAEFLRRMVKEQGARINGLD